MTAIPINKLQLQSDIQEMMRRAESTQEIVTDIQASIANMEILITINNNIIQEMGSVIQANYDVNRRSIKLLERIVQLLDR